MPADTRNIRFGFSPCPNDTFQFYALIHQKIDTGPLRFEPVLADVEALNRMALAGELELTKASYGVVGHLLPDYWCLRAGGALGRGCGPLWVARGGDHALDADALATRPIAHPGVNTTAHLLLELRLGRRVDGLPMIFHEVMDKVAGGQADSGVIIHEGRFTYRSHGLEAVEDLGAWWEKSTDTPIPLGAILLRRDAVRVHPLRIEELLRQSLLYARENPDEVMEYVSEYAQEMDEQVMGQHIDLYVNEFSLDLGDAGRAAVDELLTRQRAIGRIPEWDGPIFCPERRSVQRFS